MSDIDYVAMATSSDKDAIHAGVKGMKWGVRKDRVTGAIKRGATKADVALDAGSKVIKEGEKALIFLPKQNRQKAAARTQTRMLGVALKVNSRPEFKGKDLKKDPELREKYHKEITKNAAKIYGQELNVSRNEAWDDFFKSEFNMSTNRGKPSVFVRAMKDTIEHDDNDGYQTVLQLELTLNELGHVVGVKSVDIESSLEHGELYHAGVKGMKWGVRKDKKATAEIVAPAKGKASESSAQKFVRLTAHAKQHGANSLSDDDLKFVTQRGNAIAQVNRLNEKKPGWVADLAKQVLKQQAQKRLQAGADKLVTSK